MLTWPARAAVRVADGCGSHFQWPLPIAASLSQSHWASPHCDPQQGYFSPWLDGSECLEDVHREVG